MYEESLENIISKLWGQCEDIYDDELNDYERFIVDTSTMMDDVEAGEYFKEYCKTPSNALTRFINLYRRVWIMNLEYTRE